MGDLDCILVDHRPLVERALWLVRQLPPLRFTERRSSEQLTADVDLLVEVVKALAAVRSALREEASFIYSDFTGQLTWRVVRLASAYRFNKAYYFDAYCNLRGEGRSFRWDRMAKFECQGVRVADGHDSQAMLAAVQLDGATLNRSDFFVHPRAWGQYRKAALFLRSLAAERGMPAYDRFRLVAEFVWPCREAGRWQGWWEPQQAVGAALLAERYDASTLAASQADAAVYTGKAPSAVFGEFLSEVRGSSH